MPVLFERNSLSIVGKVLPLPIYPTSGNHLTMTVEVGKTKALVDVIHFADPSCWWSWGLEPILNRLREVYGDQISIKYKMGGITDDFSDWRREYDVVADEAL